MTTEKKDQRKWVYGTVEEQEHEALLCIATELGIHITAVVTLGMQTLIVEHAKNAKNPNSIVMVQAAAQAHKAKENQLNQLKKMAVDYMENQTEEGADELQRLCDQVGISMDKLIGGVNDAPYLKEVLKDGVTISRAETWLLENLEMGKEYAQQDIQAAAEAEGIKYHMLKEAKAKINARKKDFLIESVRTGRNWSWLMRERATLQN